MLRACEVVDIGIGYGRGLGPSPGARLMGMQSTLFWHKAQNVSHESPAAQDPSLRLGCSARRLRKTPSCKLCHPRGHARVGWAPAYVSLLAGRLRSGIRYVRMRMLAGRLRSAGCARTYVRTDARMHMLVGHLAFGCGPAACVRTYVLSPTSSSCHRRGLIRNPPPPARFPRAPRPPNLRRRALEQQF